MARNAHIIWSLGLVTIMLLLSSCNATKFVPANQYLLNKAKIHVTDTKNVDPSDLKEYLRQKPNSEIFGFWKLQLHIYNTAPADTTSKSNKRLARNAHKIGEAPSIYNEDMTAMSMYHLQKAMQNKGYFNATVDTVVARKDKKIDITYNVTANQPYTLHTSNYDLPENDLALYAKDTKSSLLKPGILFDADVLNAERKRIEAQMRGHGYYYFQKEMLCYEADSALNSHEVDVQMSLQPYIKQQMDSANKVLFKTYSIHSVTFISDYDEQFAPDSTKAVMKQKDDYYFVYYTNDVDTSIGKEYAYDKGNLYLKWDCYYVYENDYLIQEIYKNYNPDGSFYYAYTYDNEYDENGNKVAYKYYRYSDEDLQDMYYYYNEYSIYDGDVLLSKTYSNGYYSYGEFVEYFGTVEYSFYKNVKNSLEIYDVYIDGVFLKTVREEYIYYSGITVGNDAFRNMQTSVSKILSVPCPNESAENPTIIILTSDIEESIVIPEGRYVVIDLNGFSINAPKNKTAISVHGSTLFLINEKESGGIFATNGKKQTACLGVKDDGEIIIDGVSLVGKTLLELKNQTKDVIVLNGFISGSFAHVAEQPVCLKVYNCKSDFDLTPYLADNVYLVDDGSSSGVYESLFVTYKVQRELIAKLNAMGEDFDNVIKNAIKDLEMYNLRPMRDIEKDTSALYKIFRKACSDLQKAKVEALKEKAEELKTEVDQIRAEDGNSTLIKICQFVAKSTRGVVLESLNNHWNFIVSFIKGFFKIA